MDYLKEALETEEYVIALRRDFHRYPELSGKEEETVSRICEELEKLGIRYVNVNKGGVFAFLGDESRGRTVLLRADIDALPISESEYNGGGIKKPVVSEISGVSHMCGHDCHTAMLLGAAKILKDRQEELQGRVILMFERSEERGGCVYNLHKWAFENKLSIDTSFALHVDPAISKNKFHVFKDYAAAATLFFRVKIIGKTAHGAQPSSGINPIDCFVSMYNLIQTLRMRFTSPFKPVVFSVGSVSSGAAFNVIPGDLTFSGSFRFFEHEVGIKLKAELEHAIIKTAESFYCSVDYHVGEPTISLINDTACSQFAQGKFEDIFTKKALVPREPPSWSESFSLTAKLWPGVFVSLGVADEEAGITAAQHHECFDVAEEALKYGVAAHLCYSIEFLKEGPDTGGRVYSGDIDDFYRRYYPRVLKA